MHHPVVRTASFFKRFHVVNRKVMSCANGQKLKGMWQHLGLQVNNSKQLKHMLNIILVFIPLAKSKVCNIE